MGLGGVAGAATGLLIDEAFHMTATSEHEI